MRFDPFFTTKAVGYGAGLGLSVSHGIITQLGGEIALESRAGHGSTARVTLPALPTPGYADETQTPALAPPVAREPAAAARGRILIIDDEASVALALTRALRTHEVSSVRSGEAALELLRRGADFHLIFCDVMMPGLSGPEVLTALEASRPELCERVVFITGGAFAARTQELLRTSRSPVMRKPFDLPALRALVAERLRSPAR